MIDNPLAEWEPGNKLGPMQFRYLYHELLKKFTQAKVLADVVQQEFGIGMGTIASGGLEDQMLKLMMWAEANDRIPALVEWLTEDVISKVELLIDGSKTLRRESEEKRATFATSGVRSEELVSMAQRLMMMSSTLERVYAQGGQTNTSLSTEMECVRAEHEMLLREGLDNAHR